MLAFGPVPSRRLGRSLGINNVTAKTCSYSCIYCQLGNTIRIQTKRQDFYKPLLIFEEVSKKVNKAKLRNESIDYLTFVPDGEPTLDINLGKEIELVKNLEIKTAVITNASLLYQEDVRNDLAGVDLVSIKLDAINQEIWRRMNRPHNNLSFNKILDGILEFSSAYNGELITETMLVNNINDEIDEIEKIADYLLELQPKKAYIAIPTRPPAQYWVKSAKEETINTAYQIFDEVLEKDCTEYLIGYEGNAFAFTGNAEEDLLSITSVHPMREDAVKVFLNKADADWRLIKELIKEEKLIELKYQGHNFYMRKIESRIDR